MEQAEVRTTLKTPRIQGPSTEWNNQRFGTQ